MFIAAVQAFFSKHTAVTFYNFPSSSHPLTPGIFPGKWKPDRVKTQVYN